MARIECSRTMAAKYERTIAKYGTGITEYDTEYLSMADMIVTLSR